MSQIEVKMPQMGVSVTEGTVTVWHKQVGEAVTAEEPICDVATDKVDTEVPAPADGVLTEIVAAEGETIDVGATLARLSTTGAVAANGADPEPPRAAAPQDPPAADSAAVADGDREPASVGSGPFDHAGELARTAARVRPGAAAASPIARRLARDLGVDLAAVPGTGARGRIRKADVLAAHALDGDAAPALAATASATAPAAAPAGRDAATQPTGVPPTDDAPVGAPAAARPGQPASGEELPQGYEDVPHTIVATTRIRRVTADHMIRSRQTAAHMTTEVEVDMQPVTTARAALNEQRRAAGLPKLSYLPFISRVACDALRAFPDLNATFERERSIRWDEVNLGIAVDTPQGLLVPVVRGAEQLTVEALGGRIAELAAAARDRRLDADAFRAGTFTISNPGSVGAVSAMAIINQPQVAILGVPAIVRRPWVVALPDGTETIAVRPILKLALTFDHRAVDGAEATRAAVAMKRSLEGWSLQDYR